MSMKRLYIVRFGKAEYRSSYSALRDARHAQRQHLRWYLSVAS